MQRSNNGLFILPDSYKNLHLSKKIKTTITRNKQKTKIKNKNKKQKTKKKPKNLLRTFIPIILLEQAKQINFTKIISEEFVVSYDLNPFRDAKKICTWKFFSA